jgi:hypothetical protein
MTTPRSLEDLLHIEAIKQLKSDYFYLMDTKQWEQWKFVFTEDFSMEGPAPIDQGRDAFVAFVSKHLEGVISCHHGHMPVIEIVDHSTARGRWTLFDDLRFPAGHPLAPTAALRRFGYGHYHEQYRREGDQWRIASMQLTYLEDWTVPDEGSTSP